MAAGFDPQKLLTIDIQAEIRKLCGRQLVDREAHVVELVRLAVRLGARLVRVRLGWLAAHVETVGGYLPSEVLTTLAQVANPEEAAMTRHRGLVDLETTYGPAMLSLLGARWASVVSARGDSGERLRLTLGARSVLESWSAAEPGVSVSVAHRGVPWRDARVLRERCRYANLPIVVHGLDARCGLAPDDCLMDLGHERAALQGRVGLPRKGELSRTTLLVQEVLAKETFTASPRGAVHTAVVRDRLATRLDQVDTQAVHRLVLEVRDELYRRLAQRLGELSAADQVVARRRLMRYVAKSGQLELIATLTWFVNLAGEALNVTGVRARAEAGAVWAVAPGAPERRRYVVEPRAVLVLGPREREFVNEALGLKVRQPTQLSREGAWNRVGRSLRDHVMRGVELVHRFGVRFTGVRAIPESEWTATERELMTALQREVASGRYHFVDTPQGAATQVELRLVERGALPLRPQPWAGRLVVAVPRRHPRVAPLAAAVARDPAMVYLAWAALTGGQDGYGVSKTEWQAAWLMRLRA